MVVVVVQIFQVQDKKQEMEEMAAEVIQVQLEMLALQVLPDKLQVCFVKIFLEDLVEMEAVQEMPVQLEIMAVAVVAG